MVWALVPPRLLLRAKLLAAAVGAGGAVAAMAVDDNDAVMMAADGTVAGVTALLPMAVGERAAVMKGP